MNKENDELVYKYYSDESKYAFDNLKNEYISFSSLGMLNDPLEGYGAYMSHDISHDELIEHDDVNKSEEQKEAEREALENVGNMFSEWDKNYESFACRVFVLQMNMIIVCYGHIMQIHIRGFVLDIGKRILKK